MSAALPHPFLRLPRLRALRRTVACAATACGLGLIAAPPAQAVGALFNVQVIDRITGETLPTYWHQGRWYVAGKPGNRYAVSLQNRSGGRALAVLSVDGVNVVNGETAAHDQAGYVLMNGQTARITGWRKDLERVAAFEFTALSNSYASRTGRPDNVGVIGVAVFRERYVPPPPVSPPVARESAPMPSSRGEAAGAADDSSLAKEESRARRADAPALFERLGTGHGRSERSPTSYTAFERAQSHPNELIAIHYDSRDNLIAMGVIPTPRPLPDPFPATAGFVPDPPRR